MTSQRSKGQRDRQLTLKQKRFIKDYAKHGNGTKAARNAGYKGDDNALHVMAYDNLRKPTLRPAIEREVERVERKLDFSAGRVRARLDQLSHGAESVEQYGVAVRAEELLGKAAGMFVDQSISLNANLSGEHLLALVEVARRRAEQPLDLGKVGQRKRLLDE